MTSMRARLVWGVAIAAIVPLVVVMLLLTRQIRVTLGRDATRLLRAELTNLDSALAGDRERMAARLRIVAGDPALKRAYLVRSASGRDLGDALAERRFLLGLDALEVRDSAGAWVAGDSVEGEGPALRASAPILYLGQPAGRLCGALRLDRAYLARLERGGGLELMLRDASGATLATTLDSATAERIPSAASDTGGFTVRLETRAFRAGVVRLDLGEAPPATLIGLVSTASEDAMISTLQITSLVLALLAIAVAVALGVLWSSQVSRPIEEIAAFSGRLAEGRWDEPLLVHGAREITTLADALDRMRDDLRRYRSRLVTSERQAAWGLMARQVAHEVKNPLTPIAISIADLKRSHDLGRPDFPAVLEQATRTVTAEIGALRRLLDEFAEFGRMSPPRLARFQVAALFESLAALYAPDVAAGRLELRPPAAGLAFTADQDQLRQALVNLVKNGLEAIAPGGSVEVAAGTVDGALEITVTDDGPGLPPDQRERPFAPGPSTKPGGAGLGLTVVERIVSEHGGSIQAADVPAGGTRFRMRIPLQPRS